MKSPIKILFLLVTNVLNINTLFVDFSHLPKVNPETAVSLVKASTAILPQFDSIGHNVLSTNEYLINRILETNLDPAFKKQLILKVIELSRQGDEMGGKILQDYYNFIDYLL